ncbi:MAG: hypothetical protein AAGE52_08800 [Myxococcota bacterium]
MSYRAILIVLLTFAASPAFAQGVGVWRPAQPVAIPAPVAVPVATPVAVPVAIPVAAQHRAELRRQLAERRATNLARFVAYREAGEFPRNHDRPGMLNVFIDDEGHICAAANLMAHDGLLSLVQATASRDNFLQLATVQDGPLYRWMLASGFTHDEIATIQEPYAFIPEDIPEEPALEDLEKERLQIRFRQIEAQLLRNQERSLNTAVDALLAHRQAHGIPANSPVLATGDPAALRRVAVRPLALPSRVLPPLAALHQPVRDPLVWEAR